jgi:hypothetical protein
VKKEDFVYPHEIPSDVPNEPHYQRVWKYYREYNLKRAIEAGVEQSQFSKQDAEATLKFIKQGKQFSFKDYAMTKMGRRPDLQNSEAYLATERVFKAIGLTQLDLDDKSAQPYYLQFEAICDNVLSLTAEGLKEQLPILVTDEANRKKVEAILEKEGAAQVGSAEETQKLL